MLCKKFTEDLAESEEVQVIGKNFSVVEQKLEKVTDTVEKHTQQIDETRDELARLKLAPRPSSSGPYPTLGTRYPSSWVPRLVHVRAWGPFSAPMSDKIGKAAAQELQATLAARLPPET